MGVSGTCLVSWDFSQSDDGVLIVGVQKPDNSIEIINAFQGEEAKELAKKLTIRG